MSKGFTIQDLDRLKAQGRIKGFGETAEKYSTEPAKNIPLTGQQRHQALGRLKKGEMNKTEERYAGVLDVRKMAGEVLEHWFEALKLRIGDNCFYEPDFLVLMATGELEIHEVKGGWITEDGLVRFKAAQTNYPFRFRLMQWKGGEWRERS